MYKIKKSTQQHLAAHGLAAVVHPSINRLSPIGNHVSTFVRESRFNGGFGFGECTAIENITEQSEIVKGYFDSQDLDEKDVYWKVVFEDRRYGVNFSLAPISETRMEYACGFIYIKKSDAVELFSQHDMNAVAVSKAINNEKARSIAVNEMFNADIKRYVNRMFANDLKELGAYLNREVYDIHLTSNDDVIEKRSHIIDVDDQRVDDTIISLVDDCILDIENSNKVKIEIELNLDLRVVNGDAYLGAISDQQIDQQLMANIINNAKDKLHFMPRLGAIKRSATHDSIITTIDADSLPELGGVSGRYEEMPIPVLKSFLAEVFLTDLSIKNIKKINVIHGCIGA